MFGLLAPGLMGAPQRMSMDLLDRRQATNPASMLQTMPMGAPMPEMAGLGGLGAIMQQAAPQQAPGGLGGFLGNMGGDFLTRFKDMRDNNPEALMSLAAGIAGGDFAGGMNAMGQQLGKGRERNRTKQWLLSQGLDENAAEAAMSNPAIMNAMLKKKGLSGETDYSKTPIYGTDENGNTVLGTVGSDGTFKKIDTGGFNVASGIDKVDAGTKWLLYDKRTGQMVGEQPKDLAGAEAQKAIGEAQGKAAASAPGDYQAGENALAIIADIRNDPYRSRGTGFSATFNAVPGTGGYDFQNKVDQAKSGAFLTAIQQMRGLGSLSNTEGGAATAAVTRMNTATSEEAFLAALDDYEKIIRQGMERAQRAAASGGVPMPGAGGGSVDYKSKYGLD